MDFGIKELGITLMVGAFTILGFEAILHYLFNKNLIGFFEGKLGFGAARPKPVTETVSDDTKKDDSERKGEKDQTMTVTVFIVFALAIGILAEDLSYKNNDSASSIPISTIPSNLLPHDTVHLLGLPSENDDVSSLIGDLNNPRFTPLVRDLASSNAFLIGHNRETGEKVQRWILSNKPCKPGTESHDACPSIADIKGSIKGLYYYAKNSVFANPNNYDELKRIQSRLEFTRSLSLIAFIYFAIALIVGTVLLIWHLIRGRKIDKHRNRINELRTRVPILTAILFCLYLVGTWAFAQENAAFNKRAFGYFSTILISEESQRVKRLEEKLAEENRARENAQTNPAQKSKR